MSKTIQHKRSSVAGNKPDNSQIAVGELAINLADRTVFTKDASGNILELEKDIWRSAAQPDSAREGDFWYNTSTSEVTFYDGSNWNVAASPAVEPDPSGTTIGGGGAASGTGSSSDPFILNTVNATAGDTNVDYWGDHCISSEIGPPIVDRLGPLPSGHSTFSECEQIPARRALM